MDLLGGQAAAPATAVDPDLEQALLALADGGYVLSTPDGSVAESGVGVVGLLGTHADRLVGQPVADVLIAGADDATRAQFDAMLRSPAADPAARPTFGARCAEGATRRLQFVVVCVPLALGWEFTSLLSELRSRDAGTWQPEELRLRHGRALEAVEGVVLRGAQPDPDARLAGILIVVRDVDAAPLTHADVERRMTEQRSQARAAAADAARRTDEAAGRLAPEQAEEPGGHAPGLEDLVERARVLRERVEDAERDAAAAVLERDEALARLAGTEAERDAAQALAAAADDVEGRARQLAGERDEARARLEAMSRELDAVRRDAETARTAAAAAQAELTSARAAADAAGADVQSARAEAQAAQAERDSVRSEAQAAAAAAQAAQAEAQSAHADAAAARAEVEALRAQAATVGGDAQSAQAQADAARAEAQAARAEAASARAEARAAQAETGSARTDAQSANADAERLRAELLAMREAVHQRTAHSENADAELAALRAESEAAHTDAEALRAELNAARADLNSARGESALARGEASAVRAQLQSHQHELESAREQLAAAGGELQALHARLEAHDAQRGELDADLQAARAQVEATDAALAETRHELEGARGELERAQTETATAVAAADSVRAEREEARVRAQQLLQEAEQARAAAEAIRAEFAFEEEPDADAGRSEPAAQRTPWTVPASTLPPAATANGSAKPELPAVGPGEAAALIALNGSFKRLDEAFCSLLGCREEDLRAARWPSIIDRENLKAHQEIARALKAGEIQSAEIDTVYMHAQGLLVPIAGTISLHRPPGGGEPHFLFRADVSRTAGVPGVY